MQDTFYVDTGQIDGGIFSHRARRTTRCKYRVNSIKLEMYLQAEAF